MPRTILVIDDSPSMVMSLVGHLETAGFTVETAMNGQLGLARLDAGLKPDAIVTDINMPVLDGIGFIRGARRRTPSRFTPILVLTSEADKEAEARAAGASGWLLKPVQRKALIEALGRALPRGG